MTILILEDEKRIVDELNQIIRSLPVCLDILTSLSSIEAAIQWLAQNEKPDIILADVLLSDGLSFEIFDRLQLDVPVIYCTTYAEYALDSFASNVIDYIIKPVNADKLQNSLQKFFRIIGLYNNDQVNNNSKGFIKKPLPIFQGNRIELLQTSKICYVYRQHDLVYVQTKDIKYLLNRTLDRTEQDFSSEDFYRANRRFLIHRDSIVRIELLPARKLGLTLDPALSDSVVISKAKASNFLRWMKFTKSLSIC